jgi:hypothetical protein
LDHKPTSWLITPMGFIQSKMSGFLHLTVARALISQDTSL